MLSTPEHGWSNITIGDWSDRCSYLDDVPYLLVDALESVYRTYQPRCVKLDAEGWEYIIVFDGFETHIISDNCDTGFLYKTITCKARDLAAELIADIRNDFDGWAKWPPNVEEDEIKERKADLLVFCDIFEKRI